MSMQARCTRAGDDKDTCCCFSSPTYKPKSIQNFPKSVEKWVVDNNVKRPCAAAAKKCDVDQVTKTPDARSQELLRTANFLSNFTSLERSINSVCRIARTLGWPDQGSAAA
ncbi:uncharacterized protein AKAW2_21178S [Aspergillus luchuensis]|uniref:Uncharacterized protein n=1 Tax=Aspergillus kawachii TaxID=1069201 RepID=A0A7R7W4I4_ASPKA|nr:uncharacterized protein AKAW2_21178S [Aspergillus luchuensis]BCR96238.1 hypothetical protein AKAW2_21178S [Aspergillus luchuensis]